MSTTALGEKVGFFHEKKKGVDRVFVDHPLFLAKVWGKTGDKLYGKASGADYADNAKRFALFAKAVMDAPTMLPLEYGEDVVFVCNDWHSALVPVLLKHEAKPNGKYINAKEGVEYQGEWLDGMRHGQGTLTYKNGSVYEGEWQRGMKWGYGKMTYASSNFYEGDWMNNKRNGQGTMYWLTSDEKYEGN